MFFGHKNDFLLHIFFWSENVFCAKNRKSYSGWPEKHVHDEGLLIRHCHQVMKPEPDL